MSEDILEQEREHQCAAAPKLVQMSPWVVQGIVYELITSFFFANPPEGMGYPAKFKYNADKLKSEIFVDVAYNYNASVANKRPSIFISRGDNDIKGVTFGHMVGIDPKESEVARLLINTVPINVAVIASPVMMVELLADYTKQAFISFEMEIQADFNLRRFRLRQVSKPQIYAEAKEYFVVNLTIEVVYDEGWVLRRDDLKLKSVPLAIFDAVTTDFQFN